MRGPGKMTPVLNKLVRKIIEVCKIEKRGGKGA